MNHGLQVDFVTVDDAPRGMGLSPDGSLLVVAGQFTGQTAVCRYTCERCVL